MPITLNHSNINVQYSSDKSYIIETVKSDLYRRNEIVDTIIRNNIQAAPVTPTTYVDSSGNVYAVESYTYSGTADTADYTRVFPNNTTCDILIVAGGGGGGQQNAGGGGAGGLVLVQNFTANGSFTIKVGKGGNGGLSQSRGSVGNNSTFTKSDNSVIITANGGGGGGSTGLSGQGDGLLATNGGSGGGGGFLQVNGTQTQKSQSQIGVSSPAILNQFGEDGGHGGGGASSYPGGGGGGAGGVGATSASNTTGQNGGLGIDRVGTFIFREKFTSSIGDNGWFAGGGGSGGDGTSDGYGNGGSTFFGGGGNGDGIGGRINGINGTGGGGGAVRDPGSAGNGGSGIVIIRYLLDTIPTINYLTNEPVVTAPIFTETIRTFVHSGGTEAQTTYSITVAQNTICDILVVGGGGGGGNGDGSSNEPGGGGAGGVVYMINKTFTAGTYKINVGKGGASNTNGNNSTITDNNNNTITFDSILLIGKGGGKGATTSSQSGSDGGSGGGGGHNMTNGGLATQGNTFWNGTTYVAGGYNGGKATTGGRGGGGGGAGEIGDTDGAGFGGDGIQVNISGVNTFYAGGGNAFPNRTTTRSDGGGGLVPVSGNPISGGDALENTGSGGSGAYGGSGSGGKGGSGIVIIKFKSNTNAAVSEGTPATTHKRLNFTFNQDNLVAYYKFNGDYTDSNPSSTKYNLSATGTLDFQTTRFIEGQSVLFNANNEFLSTAVNFPNQFGMSYSFWFLLDDITANRIVFAIGQDFFIMLQPQVSKIYISNTMAGNETYTQPSFTFSTNTWYHLVLIFLLNGTWKLYMNGVDLNINGLGGTYPLTAAKIPTGKLFIGGKNIGYWTDTFYRGNVDEFFAFNKELSQAEITSLYNKTFSIPINQYTLNFPVPTLTDINNNSNIVLNGAYDISLNTSNALIIPKNNQYIPKPTEFTTSNLSLRYNILNPILDPVGAQWTYSSNNTNVYNIGSVGIGTSNPQYSLDINGTLNAKEYFYNGVQIGRLSEGMVANVQHLTYTHMEVKNNTGWDAINDDLATGFVISITPKSNLSKILVNLVAHIGLTNANDGRWWGFKLYRKIGTAGWAEVTGPNGTETGASANTAGTPVWISNNMGTVGSYNERIINLTGTYLDSPNTTSIVYYTAYWNQRMADNPSRTGELWLNRAGTQNDAYRPAPSSSWTLKEIWYG